MIPLIENDGRIFAFCIPADVLIETINTLGRGQHTISFGLATNHRYRDIEHLSTYLGTAYSYLVLASGIPADVLTETINSLGRGQHTISFGLATKHRYMDIEHLPTYLGTAYSYLVLASGIPADVLTETINTLGRGRHTSAVVLPQNIDIGI